MSTNRSIALLCVVYLMHGCAINKGLDEGGSDVESAREQFPDGIGLIYRSSLSEYGDTLQVWPEDVITGINDPSEGDSVYIESIRTPFSAPVWPNVYLLVPDSLEIQLRSATGEAIRATCGFFDSGKYSLYLDSSGIKSGIYYIECKRGEETAMGKCYLMR